jgi:hypothetical protein
VSHDPSRKHFFAKCLGFFAVVGLASKTQAKPRKQLHSSASVQRDAGVVTLRPESRAVSRDIQAV